MQRLIDGSTRDGARHLADIIIAHWTSRGYPGIRAKAILEPGYQLSRRHSYSEPSYTVRSNIGPYGYPPA